MSLRSVRSVRYENTLHLTSSMPGVCGLGWCLNVMPESWKGKNTCIHACNHFLYSIFLYQLWFDQFSGTCIVVCFSVLPSDSAFGGNIWTTSSWFHMPAGHPLLCFKHVSQAHGLKSFLSKPNLFSGSAMTATVSEQEGELCQYFSLY